MANEKRLIDANPIVKFIMDGLNNPDKLKALGHDAIEVLAEIEFAPTVDAVEVVHGRWYYRNPTDTLNEHLMCTACKCLFWKNIEEMVSYPYCPNCGAKMDGDGND